MEVAIEDEDVFVGGGAQTQTMGYDAIRPLHVSRMRVLVNWSAVAGAERSSTSEPPNPVYDWTPIDTAIDAAAKNGVRVELTLSGPAPAWATSNHRIGVMSPSPAAFARFVTSVARHFRGRVDRYTIWNEPNYRGWLQPQEHAARVYRSLYQVAYRAIKRIDRRAQVLIGETLPYPILSGQAPIGQAPIAFLRDMVCVDRRYRRSRCKGLIADGYAHHPYQWTTPPNKPYPSRRPEDNAPISQLGNLTRALDRLQRLKALRTPRGKPLDLYLTEFGYFSAGRRVLPPTVRSRYLREAFSIAKRNPRVRSMLYYGLRIDPRFRLSTGLVDYDWSPSRAYLTLRDWTQDAARTRSIKTPIAFSLPPAPQ